MRARRTYRRAAWTFTLVTALFSCLGAAAAPPQDTAVIQVNVLSDSPPSAVLNLVSAPQTGTDQILFQAVFSEPVSPTFDSTDLSLTGTLTGSITVQGTDPVYQITVTLDAPNTDGTVGILLKPGTVTDSVGNVCPSTSSPLCNVFNWRGFLQEPANLSAYTLDVASLQVTADCGATNITYQWWHNDAAKTVFAGPASPTWLLPTLSPSDSGTYWCEALYDGIINSSTPSRINVADHLSITAQPLGGQAGEGTTYYFDVACAGGFTPLRYQWMKNGTILANEENAFLDVGPLSAADGGNYSVEVWDNLSDSLTSDSALLEVLTGVPLAGLFTLAMLAFSVAAVGAVITRRRQPSP